MAKKHYTKAGARRACDAIESKLTKMNLDGYLSPKMWLDIMEKVRRVKKSLK